MEDRSDHAANNDLADLEARLPEAALDQQCAFKYLARRETYLTYSILSLSFPFVAIVTPV